MKYYKEHGMKPEAVQMPVHIDTFKINKMLHFKQVSELVGIPMEEIKNLNPQYVHNIVPGNEREYTLVLPYTYTNAFIDNEDSLYTHKASEYFNPATLKKIIDGADGERIIYKVKNGDYLGRIATKHRCTVAQIKKWNNLKNNNIRVGQKLVIYRGGSSSAGSSSSSASSSTVKSSSSGTSSTPSGTYTVQKGDVLSRIAEKHGCTVEQIKKWNNLSSNNIQVGQKLKVAVPASAQKAPASAKLTSTGEYTTYTVKEGDSLYSIAKQFTGVSAQNIMDFNGIGSNIKPGMTIKIPKI